MKKGTFGYLKKKQMIMIITTLGLFLSALAIFLIGYFLNNEQKNNIFTIIAVLLVLPASKALTSFIVVAPFRTVKKEKYDEIRNLTSPNMYLLTDLVITSKEKIMNLDFLVIMEENVIGVIGKSKQDASYIEDYLVNGVKNLDYNCHVKIFDNLKAFQNRINTIESKSEDNYVKDKIKSYILTLAI